MVLPPCSFIHLPQVLALQASLPRPPGGWLVTVSIVIEPLLILQKDQCIQEKWKSLLRIQPRSMDPRKAHIQNHGIGRDPDIT